MTVFMAWTSVPLPTDLAGPWEELRVAGPDLALVLSDSSLSVVYHELKWSLPEDAALIVAPIAGVPKLRGMPSNTLTWLREHAPPT